MTRAHRHLTVALLAIGGISAAAVCAAVAQRLEADGFRLLPDLWDALGVGALLVTLLQAGAIMLRSGR